MEHNISKKLIKHIIDNYKEPAQTLADAIPGLSIQDAKKAIKQYKKGL